jgi:predicted Zn-dependent protease
MGNKQEIKLELIGDARLIELMYPVVKELQGVAEITVHQSDKKYDFSHAWNEQRKQMNMEKMACSLEAPSTSIVIVEEDLYYEGLNWCFGASMGDGSIIMSTRRLRRSNHITDLVGHELGHKLGIPSTGRSNTEELLGTHCTNDLCVMQQKMTVKDAVDYWERRLASGAGLYCRQCLEELASLYNR